MSQVNAERLRAFYDAFNRRDFDALAGTARPDIELVPPGGQQAIKGAAQVRAWMEPDAFESQVIEPLDFHVVENKVLIHSRAKIRGAGSGIELESLSWAVWTLDEAGLIARIEVYLDHQKAEALEAAGLRE